MDIQMDTYTIGGIVAISAGGYLIFKAYNNMKLVSYFATIGMTVVGGMLIWGGVRLFGAKSASEKKKDTKAIKKELTKAVAGIGEATVEVAAAAEGGVEWECSKCGGIGYDPTAEEPVESDGSGESTGPEDCPKCRGTGIQKDYDKRYHGAESYEAEFSERQRTKLAKKGLALPDGAFPIRNKQDLKNAIQSWGLAKKSNKAPAKKFIKLRAKQLGAMKELPKTW